MNASAASERAAYFQDFSRRVIDQAAQLCKTAGEAAGGAPVNPCGDDLEQVDLDLIEAVSAGNRADLSPWRVAQVHELTFWRSVAFHGYDGKHPLIFPLLQEHFMVSTFYRTGWAMAEFREAKICELGCGPLGMIEYLPGARRVAVDPLNRGYARLFAKFRDPAIEYLSDHQQFMRDITSFDLAICHNTLDHTEEPAILFDEFFGKLAVGGRFIFQVNLSRPDCPQAAEYRQFHPSPLTIEQVMDWLAAKSERFEHFHSLEPTPDNEFYFLSWGTKTRDHPVSYRRPSIALTDPSPPKADAASQPSAPEEQQAVAALPRPLTSSLTSVWLSGTTIKGGSEPFVNLPPIAALASEDALQAQAMAEFALSEPIGRYRAGDTAPIPILADREWYFGSNDTGYWLSGLSDALAVTRQAMRLGVGAKPRYFELGCASGRVVRHLAFHTDVPITCCDLNKRHTEWVRLFLPERINVFHSSVNPQLPIEDNSIDVATAFSVFTHIDDFEIAWLLELRRILRPGGLAYVTVATDHTWEKYKQDWIKEQYLPFADKIADYTIDDEFFRGSLPRDKTVIWWPTEKNVYNAAVYHDRSYLQKEWGRVFTVIDIILDGHFYQDVVLLQK